MEREVSFKFDFAKKVAIFNSRENAGCFGILLNDKVLPFLANDEQYFTYSKEPSCSIFIDTEKVSFYRIEEIDYLAGMIVMIECERVSRELFNETFAKIKNSLICMKFLFERAKLFKEDIKLMNEFEYLSVGAKSKKNCLELLKRFERANILDIYSIIELKDKLIEMTGDEFNIKLFQNVITEKNGIGYEYDKMILELAKIYFSVN